MTHRTVLAIQTGTLVTAFDPGLKAFAIFFETPAFLAMATTVQAGHGASRPGTVVAVHNFVLLKCRRVAGDNGCNGFVTHGLVFHIVVTIDAVAMGIAHGTPGQALTVQLEASALFAIAVFDGSVIPIMRSGGSPRMSRMATMTDATDDGRSRFLFVGGGTPCARLSGRGGRGSGGGGKCRRGGHDGGNDLGGFRGG